MKYLIPIIILLASSIAFAQDAFVESQIANLRGTPTATGKKVTTLAAETELIIIAKDGDWYLVQSPEYMGWISGKLIKIVDTEEIPKLILLQKAKVSAKNVILLGTASESGLKTAALPIGTQMDVVAKVNEWYLVQTPAYSGWIHEDFVSEILPQKTTAKLSPTDGTLFEVESADAQRNPRISVKNDANKTLQLTFGGIIYVIAPGKGRFIDIPEGRYQYTAAGGGATPYTRVENFEKGKIYAVTFYIR